MGPESWGIVGGVIGIVATGILVFIFWRLTSRQTDELRNFLVDTIAASTDDQAATKRLIEDRLKSGELRGKIVKDSHGKAHIDFEITLAEGGRGTDSRRTSNRGKLNLLNIGIVFFGLFSFLRLLVHPSSKLASWDMWAFFALSITMALVIFGQMLRQAPKKLPDRMNELKQGWTYLLDQVRILPKEMLSLVKRFKNTRLTWKPQWSHLSSEEVKGYARFFLESLAVFGAMTTFAISWISGVRDGFVFNMGLVWFAFILMGWAKGVPFKLLIPGCMLFVFLALIQLGITPWSFLAVAFYVAVFFISKFLPQPYEIEP